MTTLSKDSLVCAFCMIEVERGSYFCYRCREYKGLSTLAEYEKSYGDFF